jgi:hypothetical protein
VDHTQEPSRLDNRSPDRLDHWATHRRLSRTGGCEGLALGFISRVDVADFLVSQIEDASLLQKTPVLTG